MQIERAWLEELIFSGEAPRRFTQDSPVLPDVWLAYAEAAEEDDVKDLLITPYRDAPPGKIVKAIRDRLRVGAKDEEYDIAHNEAVVAVRLAFDHLIALVLVLSPWWKQHAWFGKIRLTPGALGKPAMKRALVRALEDLSWRQLTKERMLQPPPGRSPPKALPRTTQGFPPGFLWFIRVAGIIALALRAKSSRESEERLKKFRAIAWDFDGQVTALPQAAAGGGEPGVAHFSGEPEPAGNARDRPLGHVRQGRCGDPPVQHPLQPHHLGHRRQRDRRAPPRVPYPRQERRSRRG